MSISWITSEISCNYRNVETSGLYGRGDFSQVIVLLSYVFTLLHVRTNLLPQVWKQVCRWP
jgi:hypothetical protein